MRIVLKNDTTKAETVLCDGATRALDKSSGPEGFSCPLAFQVQAAARLRATSMAQYNRGNAESNITFAVTRRCASQEAALVWLLNHLAQCQTSGTLILQPGAKLYSIAGVALERINHEPPTSATIKLTYILRGGRPSKT